MNLILAVPDLNDTQFVEAVRAQVGPDAIILAADDARVQTALFSIQEHEIPTIKDIDFIMEPAQFVAPSRRGRRFTNYNYHKLPR